MQKSTLLEENSKAFAQHSPLELETITGLLRKSLIRSINSTIRKQEHSINCALTFMCMDQDQEKKIK